MNTPPIQYVFFSLHLLARLIRLLFSFFENWSSNSFEWCWTSVGRCIRLGLRIASFLAGIMILYLAAVAPSGKLLDILIHTIIACDSSLEAFQAYAVLRKIDDMLSCFRMSGKSSAIPPGTGATTSSDTTIGVWTFYAVFYAATASELIMFIIIFVLPISFCSSSAFPTLHRYNFICFAIPVFINFCGQAIFDLRLRKTMEKHKWKFTFNVLRALAFATLLVISANLCTFMAVTVQQQRTISAAFLLAVTIVPTALISSSAFKRFLQALRICGVTNFVESDANSQISITDTVTLAGGENDLSIVEGGKSTTSFV